MRAWLMRLFIYVDYPDIILPFDETEKAMAREHSLNLHHGESLMLCMERRSVIARQFIDIPGAVIRARMREKLKFRRR